MAEPAATDFVISQGDSQPVMPIRIPRNSAGELVDLEGCTVTFLGRAVGNRTNPPAIRRPIASFETKVEYAGTPQQVSVVMAYVHLTTADTKSVAVPSGSVYMEMEGELEIVDADGEVLTIPNKKAADQEKPYIRWWIRDDIGDGAA